MSREPWEETALEARLRAAMPAPPPELRARILARCGAGVPAARRPRPGRRWALALAGCLASQWCLAALLDGQRGMMLRGGSGPDPSLAAAPGHMISLPSGRMAFTVGHADPRLAIE